MLLVALAGCVGGPGESPAEFFRQATAADPLFGRAAPPGLDGAFPGLDRVPQAPARLSPEAVDALSAQLVRDREAAAMPRAAGAPVPPRPASPGGLAVPERAPAPAALAVLPAPPRLAPVLPAVPPGAPPPARLPAPPPLAAPAAAAAPPAPPAVATPAASPPPAAPPAPPAPDLLAPPPPALLAPARRG